MCAIAAPIFLLLLMLRMWQSGPMTNWRMMGVVVSRDYKFMCSSLGQELIENDIKELDLTRVVVAACSPHLARKDFSQCLRSGGIKSLFVGIGIGSGTSFLGAHR